MTRARVTFKDYDTNICTVYIHSDGYISGLGHQLSEQLGDYTIVNGLSIDEPEKIANGMGCLAAQWVAMNKTKPGYLYLDNPVEDKDTRAMIDYHYFLSNQEGKVWAQVFRFTDEQPIYNGWLSQLKDFEEE